ncbi:hypothetical protein U91I_01176 [alpha proteobacterium U9-1i]|nr:hypothetical protein U91I_01176 [alpha proteobacterium U9-1i]
MSKRSVQHATFVIEREFEFPLAVVYAAWADKNAKSRWFASGENWTTLAHDFDYRVGGREVLKGRFASGPRSDFDGAYHDIAEDARIIYAYDMEIDGARISVSLATVEFEAIGKRTKIKLTEQGAFLDGLDDAGKREAGMRELLDALDASLRH